MAKILGLCFFFLFFLGAVDLWNKGKKQKGNNCGWDRSCFDTKFDVGDFESIPTLRRFMQEFSNNFEFNLIHSSLIISITQGAQIEESST